MKDSEEKEQGRTTRPTARRTPTSGGASRRTVMPERDIHTEPSQKPPVRQDRPESEIRTRQDTEIRQERMGSVGTVPARNDDGGAYPRKPREPASVPKVELTEEAHSDKSSPRGFPKTVGIVLIVLSAVLLAALAFVSVFFINKSRADGRVIESAEKQITELTERRDSLAAERDALTAERDELLLQVDELSRDTDERLLSLQREIDDKTAEIDGLNTTIDSYRSIYAVDVRQQMELVNELTDLIENGAPLHNLKEGVDPEKIKVGDVDEDGNEITEKDLYDYPKISVYYEDIATGFKYTYNANDSMFSASVVKAVYLVSVMEDASAAYEEALANRRNADDPLEYSNPDFDLENTKWVMMNSDKREGSGVLTDMPEGTEFTLLELVQYAIEKSDNTAFYRLRAVFGYDSFYAMAARLGVTGMKNGFNYMSASDTGKFFRHIYEFIESDAKYASVFKEYLLNASHRVMIPYAVSPTKVAHKYGWDTDSYHDAAIVFEDKPYILVVMTDMDEGGDEVNEYIRSIIRLVAKLHRNFYG